MPSMKPAAGKSTSSVGMAAQIVKQVFGSYVGSKHTVPVMLPRKDHPVYLMPTKQAQPWGLLPMKAAAYVQYPNFFNNSCNFFGSIGRDMKARRPCSILRVSKLALDLAKALRNLGILSSFHIGQKLDHLGDQDYLWQEHLEPEHITELKLYNYKFLKLDLRWDLYKPVWGSTQQTLSQTPLDLPESLPMSVTNISRASQPVFLAPDAFKQELQRYPSGIFMMYHHELGVTTDAALTLLKQPGLVMAHLGLPYSHVAQIYACTKQKLREQQDSPASEAVPLKDWSMVDYVKQLLDERLKAVGEGPQVERQKQEIRRIVEQGKAENEVLISDFDVSRTLQDELLAWQLKDKLAQPASSRGSGATRGGGSASGPSYGAGRGQTGPRFQSPRRDSESFDDSSRGPRGSGSRGSSPAQGRDLDPQPRRRSEPGNRSDPGSFPRGR